MKSFVLAAVCGLLVLAGCRREPPAPQQSAAAPKPAPAIPSAPPKQPTKPTPAELPKKIVPEPVAPEPPAPPRILASDTVPVEITIKPTTLDNYQVVIAGTTNLPTGTRLHVAVSPQESTYTSIFYPPQNVVVDREGKFASAPIGNPEVGILAYLYEIEVALDGERKQPPEVLEQLGENWEHLQGPLVQTTKKQKKIVEAKAPLDMHAYDSSLSLAEIHKLHLVHSAEYLQDLRTLQQLLLQVQKLIQQDSSNPAINEQLRQLKSRIDHWRRDRKMQQIFGEHTGAFQDALLAIDAQYRTLERRNQLAYELDIARVEKGLINAEAALKEYQAFIARTMK